MKWCFKTSLLNWLETDQAIGNVVYSKGWNRLRIQVATKDYESDIDFIHSTGLVTNGDDLSIKVIRQTFCCYFGPDINLEYYNNSLM